MLEADPDLDVQLYVVWEPMLGGKHTDAVAAMALIPDPRARHFWSPDFLVGRHFHELGIGRIA